MVKRHEPSLDGTGLRVGIVVSRFNNVVTDRLLEGALDGFRRHGVADDRIEVASVPGAFELPLAATLMAASARVDTIACLGAVVRGETPHFDMIAIAVVDELEHLSVAHRLPIALGVLTTNTIEQALERAGGTHGNKGYDAALVALEMANLRRRFA
jgi:6,7-dimethyl-8-ribityllumazine synthase